MSHLNFEGYSPSPLEQGEGCFPIRSLAGKTKKLAFFCLIVSCPLCYMVHYFQNISREFLDVFQS